MIFRLPLWPQWFSSPESQWAKWPEGAYMWSIHVNSGYVATWIYQKVMKVPIGQFQAPDFARIFSSCNLYEPLSPRFDMSSNARSWTAQPSCPHLAPGQICCIGQVDAVAVHLLQARLGRWCSKRGLNGLGSWSDMAVSMAMGLPKIDGLFHGKIHLVPPQTSLFCKGYSEL